VIKTNPAYLEIFRDFEERRVRYRCYAENIIECKVKHITTWIIENQFDVINFALLHQ